MGLKSVMVNSAIGPELQEYMVILWWTSNEILSVSGKVFREQVSNGKEVDRILGEEIKQDFLCYR